MTFGKKLLSLRKQSNYSQEALAQKLGISRQVISKWEKGKGLPDIDNLKKIASLFKVTIDELLDYKLEEINIGIDESIEPIKKKDRGYKKIKEYVLKKFEKADEIYELSQEINLNIWQEIIYSLLDFDVVLGLHDLITNGLVYSFFVRQKSENYLVISKKSTLMTKRISNDFSKRHLVVDGYRYEKVRKIK